MRFLALAFTVMLLASACISITPVAKVATAPTDAPATAAPLIPTVPPQPTPTTTPPTTPASPSASDGPTTKPTTPPAPTPKPTQPETTLDPNDPACQDDAYSLEGFSWNEVYRWRYNADSTPSGMDPDAAEAVIEQGIANITGERNDCGRPATINAFAHYMGKTTLQPCTDEPDGANTIGWGDIPSDLSDDVIAYTCPYHYGGLSSEYAAEADIVINDQMEWALSKDQCFFEELLEPTITHEAGHVFGLGHVNERQHPDLTMSTTSNGPCDDVKSTLGLGDMLGLESLYGPHADG